MARAKTQESPREMYRRIQQERLKSEKLHDFTRPVVCPGVARAASPEVVTASIGRSREKMLPQMNSAANGKTILTNPATKMIDLMSGHVQKRSVRCGRARCRCSRGIKHISYYHVWHQNGRRYQKYIRKADVENYIIACMSNRLLQSTLRKGRAEYKKLLASARELWRPSQ